MTARILECQRVLPGTDCTLLFIGSEEDVVHAAAEHAASHHGVSLSEDLLGTVRSQLEPIVFPGSDRVYLGDLGREAGTEGVRTTGPAYSLQRFGDEGFDGIDITCACGSGDGSCDLTIEGPFATCGGGCTHCFVKTTIPTGPHVELKVLAPPTT
jgi:predicted small metal-binding protein